MIKTKTILDQLAEPNLSLYKGQGYYYFVYDDGDKVYEERCVMVNVLNHPSAAAFAVVSAPRANITRANPSAHGRYR